MGGARERHSAVVARLRRTILDAHGVTDPALRQAAFDGSGGGGRDEVVERYLGMVRSRSAYIGDALVDEVRAAGSTDDEIFELTVAAAAGEAFRRLEAGLRAM